MHHPSAPPGAQAPHDKDYLRRLLAERNQAPGNAAGIDAAIEDVGANGFGFQGST